MHCTSQCMAANKDDDDDYMSMFVDNVKLASSTMTKREEIFVHPRLRESPANAAASAHHFSTGLAKVSFSMR